MRRWGRGGRQRQPSGAEETMTKTIMMADSLLEVLLRVTEIRGDCCQQQQQEEEVDQWEIVPV